MTVISQPRGMRQSECWSLTAECPIYGQTKTESMSVSYWKTEIEAIQARHQLGLSGCGGFPCTPEGHKIRPPKGSK
jgi:hypothetical protein